MHDNMKSCKNIRCWKKHEMLCGIKLLQGTQDLGEIQEWMVHMPWDIVVYRCCGNRTYCDKICCVEHGEMMPEIVVAGATHARAHDKSGVYLAYLLEQSVAQSGDDALSGLVSQRPHHCVRLPRTCQQHPLSIAGGEGLGGGRNVRYKCTQRKSCPH